MFLKPEIKFPAFPLIMAWIEKDYEQVATKNDLIEFVFDKLNEMETTTNHVRKAALKSVTLPLYSIITNKSYESKITI